MPRAGPPSCISVPARAAVGISMQSVSSPARGLASSGAAGRIALPTTLAGIAPRRRSPLPERAMLDTGCLMPVPSSRRLWSCARSVVIDFGQALALLAHDIDHVLNRPDISKDFVGK